jgi:hypothetical protein
MKKEDTANLTLQPTVPYGCYARVNDDRDIPCKISINLYYPELSDNLCSIGDTDTGSQPKVEDVQAKCGVEISVPITPLFSFVSCVNASLILIFRKEKPMHISYNNILYA